VIADLYARRLPNALMAAGLSSALSAHLLSLALGLHAPGWQPLAAAALAALLMLAAGAALWRVGLFGAGDAKLLAVAAGHFAPAQVLPLLLHSLLAGGAVALLCALRRTPSVPYAVAIAGGCALTLATGGGLLGGPTVALRFFDTPATP
jgi:prepilin peptidase CpaA